MESRPVSMSVDAYSPREMARRVRESGVTKARADSLTLFVLAILAGAFISFGAIFYTVTVTSSALGFGVTRMLGGVAFSLGLILVVIGGAELFTGNNLIAMAWASRLVTLREVLRNWGIVYAGNVVGSLATVMLAWLARVHEADAGGVGLTIVAIGRAKATLGFIPGFFAGVACNALVCLAVWLSMSGRTTTDRILAIVFPTTAFVAIGFEHSIANWFLLPWAGLAGASDIHGFAFGACRNLLAVTLGNVVGGTLLVAGVYWLAYLRNDGEADASAPADES